jgi:hypothetical protein
MEEPRVLCEPTPYHHEPCDEQQKKATTDHEDGGDDDAKGTKRVGGPAFHGLELPHSVQLGDPHEPLHRLLQLLQVVRQPAL